MSTYRHLLAWRIVSCTYHPRAIEQSVADSGVCVVSIIRATQIRDVSLTDLSWSDVDGVVWSVVELNLGIVSACLPTLRPFEQICSLWVKQVILFFFLEKK